MKSKHTLFALVAFLSFAYAHGQTRDPSLWPFGTESIWNMPIHKDAWKEGNHEDANIDVVGAPSRFKGEGVQMFIEDPADPLREYHRVKWTNRCTDHFHYKDNDVHFPDDYTWNGEENSQKNSAFVLIKPDHETIWDGTLFTRCTEGSWVGGAWFAPDRPYSIYGSGAGEVITSPDQVEDIWGHGASKMSALGGTIRKGELTSPEDQPIRHPLKFTIWAKRYLASCELFGGKSFIWPAQGADGYACGDGDNRYQGTNVDFVMGSLLALPPDLTKEDLGITTLAGRKIFDALQTYGGYPVEDAAWDNWQFFLEEEAVYTDWPTGSHAAFTSGVFFNELRAMISHLHIIRLNTPDSIAGGPTSDYVNRMAPVACPIGTFGSGEVCPEGPIVRLISPVEGVSYPSGSELEIIAEVSGDTGAVDSVLFYVNDSLIAMDPAAPYSTTWTTGTDGPYTFRAVVVDSLQELYSSIDVSVYMGNRAPHITLTSPAPGDFFFEGEAVGFSAEAEDPDGTVQEVSFCLNDSILSTDAGPPYKWQWTAAGTGNFEVTAFVVDNGGDTAFSDTVSLTLFEDFAIGDQQVPNSTFATDEIPWQWINPGMEPAITLDIVPGPGDPFLEIAAQGSKAAQVSSTGQEMYRVKNTFTRGLREAVKYEFEFDAKSTGSGPAGLTVLVAEDTILDDTYAPADTFMHHRYILEHHRRGPLKIRFNLPGTLLPAGLDHISLVRGVRPELVLGINDTLYTGTPAVIAAETDDADGTVERVEFFINGVSAEVDLSDPFGFLFTPSADDAGSLSIRAVATDNDGMTTGAERQIVVLNATGLDMKWKGRDQISIYPNPSSGSVFIRLNNGLKAESITVLDPAGRELQHIEEPLPDLEIKSGVFPAGGLYLIRIRTDRDTFIKKVTIVR